MFKCLSPGAIGLEMPWEQCLPLAEQAGFEGIDLCVDPKLTASWYLDALAAHHLKAGGCGLPVSFRDSKAEYDRSLKSLPALVARSAEVGVRRFAAWVWPFSDERTYKQNFAFHVERLTHPAKILADHDCRLALEFLGPRTLRQGHKYPFVRTMEQMTDLCAAIGRNVGLLVDCWHWYTSLGTPEDLLALEPSQVIYVHLADALADVNVDQQQDQLRCLPGATGVIDIGGFLQALRKIGYDGPVSPEPCDPSLRQLSPLEAVTVTAQALDQVWAAQPQPV